MSSKAITERTDEPRPGPPRRSEPEAAPSLTRQDEPTVPRFLGSVGLFLVILAKFFLISYAYGSERVIGPGWGGFFGVVGLGLLLFHAANDSDLTMRRAYLGYGSLWLLFGVAMTVIPFQGGVTSQFLPWGLLGLIIGLLFVLAALRHETDSTIREWFILALGIGGAILALVGFASGLFDLSFLLAKGVLFVLLGLVYLCSFVSLKGADSDTGYYTGLGMGLVGLVVLLSVIGRLVYGRVVLGTPSFLMPWGLEYIGAGLLYLAVSLGFCSDSSFVAMTRRELNAFFQSFIVYQLLGLSAVLAWLMYFIFVADYLWGISLTDQVGRPHVVPEPIVYLFIINFFPIIFLIFLVPNLTMRIFSEEKQTGTLEMLLTAPDSEATIVLSKFVAVMIFYMLIWLPFGLVLIGLRVEGGKEFDYRPMLAFYLVLLFTGANFTSMGIFFSSLTRNQMVAAGLTFDGLFILTLLFFIKTILPLDETKTAILAHMSYIDLWLNTFKGKLAGRELIFHLSAAVFWLFLTVKVLESRKWR
jgi:ABC-type transport system involved in multi-copper enzyme maturation permease subunit